MWRMQSGERASECPQATDEPPGSRKAPQFALWATHSSVSGGEAPGGGRAGRGWPALRRGLLRGACQAAAGTKRPLPTSWTALHRRQLQLFVFFTSSAPAVRGAVFLFHSNRNYPYTSISVNCCTQNAKRLLGCLAVKTTGPAIFCFNNKKFNLQGAKDQMVCSKLTIFHIPLPPPIVLVSKS